MKEAVTPPTARNQLSWGIRVNLAQFALLAVIVFWVGSVVGVERVVVPLLGTERFGLTSYLAILGFVASFWFVKAFLNLGAGRLADRWGRRPTLIVGWLVVLPVPFLLAFAPSWDWVIAANALVGVNQGLAWSMSVTSQIDLAGPRSRGLAVGVNEAAGYAGVTVGAIVGAILAVTYLSVYPYVYLLGVILVALALSVVLVRETHDHALRETAAAIDRPLAAAPPSGSAPGGWLVTFVRATWRDRNLAACNQAGLIEKFVDTVAWGLFPVFFVARGVSLPMVGILVGLYTGVWAVLQLFTGALSDRIGRRIPIVVGMELAGAGVALTAIAPSLLGWVAGAVAMGTGMALLYPTLLAAVSDLAKPSERGTTLGVYRFWRDSGYGIGAIASGLVADAVGLRGGFLVVALLMAVSGGIVATLLRTGPKYSHPP